LGQRYSDKDDLGVGLTKSDIKDLVLGQYIAPATQAGKMPRSRNSLIDDVQLQNREYGNNGPPVLFTNPEIRRMLKLVKASGDDILYDLGCGYAQNLIIAASEFEVRKCIGIEDIRYRADIAKRRLRRWGLSNKIRVICRNLDDAFQHKIINADIREATIVFYGLSSDPKFVKVLSEKLREGCRFVYYYNCLIPEIMPDRRLVDFPFYASVTPFTQPGAEEDWLRAVVNRRDTHKLSKRQLWDELYHDYEIWGIDYDVGEYEKRLRELFRQQSR
jgi:SAM-dependent methyltransferase